MIDEQNIKQIPLTQGKFAIVSTDDYEHLMQWKWCVHSNGYACRRSSNNEIMLMHRFIMQTPSGMDTDHINGDKLDNRKLNLRICTRSQNNRNQKPQIGKTSKYKGVYWYKNEQKWIARIKKNKKDIYCGRFKTEIEAARAYNEAAITAFGEFARLNNV